MSTWEQAADNVRTQIEALEVDGDTREALREAILELARATIRQFQADVSEAIRETLGHS